MERARVAMGPRLFGAAVSSGLAALGYELLWTRLLAASLGSEPLGVLGVLLGFFGGLALGALLWHRRVHEGRSPLRTFAALELAAALYAVASPYLLLTLPSLLPASLSEASFATQLSVTVVVSGLALLPATLCLGGTLPALVEAHRRAGTQPGGRSVAVLYAGHTLGATCGALLTVHAVLPLLGYAGAAVVLAAAGGGAAALAWSASRASAPADAAPEATSDASSGIDLSKDPDAELLREPWLIFAVLLATGCLGIGLEVVTLVVLGQVLENTIYTFAHALAVYLVGTSAGAALYARFARRAVAGRPATVAALLLWAMSIATVGTVLLLAAAPALLDLLTTEATSVTRHVLAELAVAAFVLGPATIVMGALFSHLMGLVAARGLGRAYAINTFGAALAPLVFGLGVIPAFGYRDGMFVIVYGYLFVFGAFTWFRRFGARVQVPAILGVMLLTAAAPKDLVLAEPPEGWRTLEQRETAQGLVLVSEDPRGQLRRLQVGKYFRMGGAQAFGERRMGYLPLVLHPGPNNALFLGIGTGATLSAVRDVPLQRVDAVELMPDVIDMMPHFATINRGVHEDPKVTYVAADARRFVATSEQRYDVVVADLFHPGLEGAGRLYTREHFANIRDRLTDNGHFAQWLPLYQLDLATFRAIVATFVDVFPDADAFLGIYNVGTPALVLIGSRADGGLAVDFDDLGERLSAPIYGALLMQDPRDLLGAHLADAAVLREFAGDAPRNTDLVPIVTLQAPRTAYVEARDRGWNNLRALLQAGASKSLPLVESQSNPIAEIASFHQALVDYLNAEALRQSDEGVLSDEALELYLTAYERAPEFVPARGVLLQLALRNLSQGEAILARMHARAPNDERVVQTYAAVLEKLGKRAEAAALRRAPADGVAPRSAEASPDTDIDPPPPAP